MTAPTILMHLWHKLRLTHASSEGVIRGLSYLCACGIGVALVVSVFPRDILLGAVLPDTRLIGDAAAHVVGQRAFLQDSWHWPLLKTTLLDWPTGVSIAMTDSIPLIALPLKVLKLFLPSNFSAVQLWLAVSYLLQPIAAVFALRSAGETRLSMAIAVSLFSVTMPTFLYRHPQSALSSHFLILLSLAVYFRMTRSLSGQAWMVPALLIASLLVHPYLFFMVAAVLAAAPVTLLLHSRRRSFRSAYAMCIGIGLTYLVSLCLGYASTNPSGGFGLNSMNAISPVYPSYSRYLGRGLPALDSTGAQYEGYQFLGLGLLTLIAVTLTAAVLSTRTRFLRHHFGLALACLALTALSLSSTVYVGNYKLLSIEPVPQVLEQLRSSGRLFWPVTYLLMIGCVATMARLLPYRIGLSVVLATALLQVADARDMRRIVAKDLRATYSVPLNTPALSDLMRSHRHLTILPTFGCGADANAPEFMQLLLAAVRYHVIANTMYTARFANLPDCSMSAASERPLEEGELRVFLASNAHTGPFLVPNSTDYCRMLDVVSVCTLNTAPLAQLSRVVAPTVPLAQDIPAGGTATNSPLGPGWYLREPEGVWSIDKSASLVANLQPHSFGGLLFRATMQGFTGKHGLPQTVFVSVNGRELTRWDAPDREDGTLELPIPSSALVNGPQVLRFYITNPTRPTEITQVNDTRQLGVFLRTFRFEAMP